MAARFQNLLLRQPHQWTLAASSPEHTQQPGQLPSNYQGGSGPNPPSSLTLQQKIGRQMNLGDQRKTNILEQISYRRAAANSAALGTGQPATPNVKPLQQQLQMPRRQRGRKAP